ncbi:MAG TPA: MFS transporter [Conexibacter sp.]|nr:MFS transporter [Conexibacter sp.]
MSAAATPIDRATKLALVATGLAIFVVANDFTALAVALPAIERDFHVDVSTVQWTINAYALVFGVFTVTGGRLADLLGRRRIFVTGAGIFAGCSLIGALAPSIGVLIVSRAAMGIGGAMMWPATLGMMYGLLPESRKGLAGALVLGVAGIGNAAGPLLGGVITDAINWRWVLVLNIPIAIAAILVVMRTVGETRDDTADRRFDWAGTAALSGSLVLLLVALDQVDTWGWSDPRVIGALVLSALLMLLVIPLERRAGPHALLPDDVLANRDFRASVIAVLLMSMTFFTAIMYLPQFMEKLLGWSALRAGAGLLPLMLVFGASSFAAGPLYERWGGKRVIVAGAACLPVGMLLLSLLDAGSGYGVLVPGMVLLGIGVGLFYSAMTTFAIGTLDESRASLAGGILYMFQVAGGSIGLGIATTIVSTAAGHQVEAGGSAGAAFTDGLQTTLRVSGVLALVGFFVALVFVGRGTPREQSMPRISEATTGGTT